MMDFMQMSAMMLKRAEGCMMGQLAGDALGSLVEFRRPDDILRDYPGGVRLMADGGTFNTIAGQPTDDSEMALALGRSILANGTYSQTAARKAYQAWLASGPFDCGNTVQAGLTGTPNTESQANGALMRVSPLGIFGARMPRAELHHWAGLDADITHPHRICREVNILFADAIAEAVSTGCSADMLYDHISELARLHGVDPAILAAIYMAQDEMPVAHGSKQGWVLIAFQIALYQLLHAESLEEAIVDTIMLGGDTDTNAAICGALLGAVHGIDAIPDQWMESVLDCRPENGRPNVHRPRPEEYWPVDALDLARSLISVG